MSLTSSFCFVDLIFGMYTAVDFGCSKAIISTLEAIFRLDGEKREKTMRIVLDFVGKYFFVALFHVSYALKHGNGWIE